MSNRGFTDSHNELLDSLAMGSEDAFRELYDQTHKKIYSYLYRMLKDKETAEDIMVETFTEVWGSAQNFRGKSKVLTWIMSIARNLAMNHFKNHKDLNNIDDLPNLSDNSMPDAEPLSREGLLKKAMSGLSPKHTEILDMVFLHEMNYQEVSELLKVPLNTVKTRVFYAKEALKESFNNIGVGKSDI